MATLNSDELGEKGQHRFAELCEDAKLTCNPSQRDRTGWDFIIEFPFDPPDKKLPLDARRSPLSCHVQVKTKWAHNDAFKIRLSSAERLAKELKPSFVYVFKVDRDLTFVESYVLHILDDMLSSILKRLRFEEARQTTAINKRWISFRASTGQGLAPTGEALRAAVFEACGPDVHAYAIRKEEQLRRLGFDERPHAMQTTIIIDEKEKIADVFLGLEKAKLSELATSEKRFGITLATNDPAFSSGTIHIQPGAADQCTITVREDALSPPAIFQGDVFVPAIRLPKELRKLLIRSTFFRIEIKLPKMGLTIDHETINAGRFSFDEWINFFRMITIFSRRTGSLDIVSNSGAVSLSIPVSHLTPLSDAESPEKVLDAFERAKELLRVAGAPEPQVTLKDVHSIVDQIINLSMMLHRDPALPLQYFVPEDTGNAEFPEKTTAVCVNCMRIADTTIAYSAIAELVAERNGEKFVWRVDRIELRKLTFLRNFPQDYDSFKADAQAEAGLSNGVAQHPAPDRS